jgi:SAM-dependent methyltransferase
MTKKTDRTASSAYELDGQVVRQSMMRRLPRRYSGASRLTLPAVPALLDHFVEMLGKLFKLYGRAFSREELEHLRGLLEPKLDEGFRSARNSRVIVEYQTDEPPKTTLSYTFALESSSLEQEYAAWLPTRTGPPFGALPDSKVMDLARSLGAPADVPVLDIGAGTGRNALALARAGFPIDAIELCPDFAKILFESAAKEQLTVRTFQADVLGQELPLPEAHYALAILCQLVSDLRDVAALEVVFERAAKVVRPGGLLLLSAFLPLAGYRPDRLARELSYVFWSSIFLRDELRAAAGAHGFNLLSEEPVFDYEKERAPANAWPPTSWFEEWARGVETFDVPISRAPVEMRWLTYRKTG